MHPVLQNLGFNSFDDDIVTISDNKYRFNVILLNTNGNFAKINYSAIVDFKMTDRITSFYTDGYIIFNNQLDALESFDSIGSNTDGEINKSFKPYTFRGDGRDLLLVQIEPFIDRDDTGTLNNPKTKNPDLSINYLFSVYDSEDLIYEDKTIKQKKLFLYDYTYQLLKEKNSYFSTGRYSKGVGDGERSIYTGDAIKKLLEEVYKEYNLTLQTGDWDQGGTKIFYSSPSHYKAIDDLQYLLDNHVSDSANQNSPAILMKHNEVWSLIPITQLFKNAYYRGNNSFGDLGGPGIIENFILGKQQTDSGAASDQPKRTPSSIFSYDLTDYSLIDNFQISNPASVDVTNNLVSHMVHNYDANKKMFSIDITENNINKNIETYKKNFVNTLKGSKGLNPTSNLSLNQTRLQQKNIINKYNPNTDPISRLNSGRNRFLLSSIFLNTTISFRCRGNVVRNPGKFITISRSDSQTNNEFDNKSLGMYMITTIEHVFGTGTYFNNIVAVKTYNFNKSNNNDTSI
jgi:hypothetical protein